MKNLDYRIVFYSTVVIFIALFFFLNNNWINRITLFILAVVLVVIIKFVPKKAVNISVFIVLIVFEIIEGLFIHSLDDV